MTKDAFLPRLSDTAFKCTETLFLGLVWVSYGTGWRCLSQMLFMFCTNWHQSLIIDLLSNWYPRSYVSSWCSCTQHLIPSFADFLLKILSVRWGNTMTVAKQRLGILVIDRSRWSVLLLRQRLVKDVGLLRQRLITS